MRVLFVGAGAVNFGGAEGPWDHASRLEQLGGVQVVAIADPDLPKARRVLENKLSGDFASLYRDCAVVSNYKEALETAKPDVAFIGKFLSELLNLLFAAPAVMHTCHTHISGENLVEVHAI